jgi:prepilin-type N-terminal cleavage/methylation domain-containing protein
MKRQQAGFTLVEIAIVLVIVGLLLGGVLKGQEIITNARIKNLENDFNGISAAIYSYQDRYRRLPGDDPGATRFAPVSGIAAAHVGSGDGVITGDFDSTTDTHESRLFWLHLRSAGLVSGVADATTKLAESCSQPLNAFGGIVGVSTDPGTTAMPGLFVGYSRIPQEIAIILETRIDDNEAKKGAIQSDQANYTATTNPLHELYFAL